jgi:hypothetical protein
VSWTWESSTWRKSVKLLLLLAMIWPIVYMALFMVTIISIVATAERHDNPCGQIDVLQLDKKIRDGGIKKLSLGDSEINAVDQNDCNYQLFVRDSSSRDDILKDAREVIDGRPRVKEIDEHASRQNDLPPPFNVMAPFAFMVLMVLHMTTILLMTAQMPFYIVLAVKNVHLEQTMRIVWIVLFALVSVLASPVYWYLYIWRKPKDAAIGPGVLSVP